MTTAAHAKHEREWRSLLRLALPLVVVNIGNQLMGVVDTALSGRIDALAQAATGLGNTVFFFGALLGIGITMGVDPMTSQAFGAGRLRAARNVLWQGSWAALLLTPPLVALVFAMSRSLETIGIAPDLAVQTRLYVDARLASLPLLMLLTTARSYLQSAHLTGAIVVATLIANVFNAGADWVLMFGDAGLVELGLPAIGLPALGVVGIGWATSLATLLSFAIFAWAVRRVSTTVAGAELGMRRFDSEAIVHRPHPRMIRRVFMLGLPIGLHMLAEISIFTLAGLLAGRIGTVPMAAHQVALQLAALTFMVPMGVAAATSVRVGRAIGAGEPERVRGAGMTGIAMGAAFMSISALAMWSFNDAFARVMTSDPAVLPLASELIVIAAAFQLFDGIQVVSAGALRGAGVTRWTMVANLIAYWIIAVPLVLILGFGMGFGPHGIWWGLTIGLATAAALLSAKFSVISRAPIVQLETV